MNDLQYQGNEHMVPVEAGCLCFTYCFDFIFADPVSLDNWASFRTTNFSNLLSALSLGRQFCASLWHNVAGTLRYIIAPFLKALS